jgi:hypothetical protein
MDEIRQEIAADAPRLSTLCDTSFGKDLVGYLALFAYMIGQIVTLSLPILPTY